MLGCDQASFFIWKQTKPGNELTFGSLSCARATSKTLIVTSDFYFASFRRTSKTWVYSGKEKRSCRKHEVEVSADGANIVLVVSIFFVVSKRDGKRCSFFYNSFLFFFFFHFSALWVQRNNHVFLFALMKIYVSRQVNKKRLFHWKQKESWSQPYYRLSFSPMENWPKMFIVTENGQLLLPCVSARVFFFFNSYSKRARKRLHSAFIETLVLFFIVPLSWTGQATYGINFWTTQLKKLFSETKYTQTMSDIIISSVDVQSFEQDF